MDLISAALVAALAVLAAAAGLLVWLRARPVPLPPLPADLVASLDRLVAHRGLLAGDQRVLHECQARRFLERLRFVGCDGLSVTEDMRVAIAGLACLLILRPGVPVFPNLREVLVYPGAFLVPVDEPDELGLVDDDPQARIGESWRGDRVIVAWDEVQAALEGAEHNVVVHEFTHQLDDETPGMPGAPSLRDYDRWSDVMRREFERLRRHRRPPVLDPYGGESPAEFFAVVSESYFQRGPELQRHHADLYRLLADYYRVETAV